MELSVYREIKRRPYRQPQFVRSRQRYRGVRESEKLNLEAWQTDYDIRKLYLEFATIKEDLQASVLYFVDEYNTETVSNVDVKYDGETIADLVLFSFANLVKQFESLEERLSALES